MPYELLQILVPALLGAASGYFVNQLPPLRMFHGSKLLVVAVVIELAVLTAIWGWLSGEVAKTSHIRGLVQILGAVFLGAFLVNLVQLVFGNLRNSPQPGTGARTVVRGTTIKGEKNKARINKSDALVENTEIDGKENEFSVTDDGNPPTSGQQHNPPNP